MNRRVVEVEPSFRKSAYTSPDKFQQDKLKHPKIQEYKPPQTYVHGETDPDAIPLELMPVIRTLKGYGKRAHALGALRGARALEKVVNGLMPHVSKFPELVDVILEAKSEADAIRDEVTKSADGEQRDDESDF